MSISIGFSFGCASHNAQLKNAEGVQLFSQGSYDPAIKAFEEAIQLDANDANAYYNIASTQHHIAKTTGERERFEQAEVYYRLALSKNPDFAAAYRGLSVLYVDNGKEKEAFELLTAWATSRQDKIEPKMELARLYSEYGKVEDASNCIAAAYAISPEDPKVLRAFGYVREMSGDPNAALTAYKESLKHEPQQDDLVARVAYLETRIHSPILGSNPNGSSSAGTVAPYTPSAANTSDTNNITQPGRVATEDRQNLF